MEEMESVKEEIEHHGFKFLLMLRLIPVLHYDLPASISARMNVGWAQYLGATMIGTLPRAVLLGFFGSSLLALYPWKLIVLAVVATGIASLGYTLKKHMEHTFDKKELKEEAKRFQPPV